LNGVESGGFRLVSGGFQVGFRRVSGGFQVVSGGGISLGFSKEWRVI